jgi:hypothetical protein
MCNKTSKTIEYCKIFLRWIIKRAHGTTEKYIHARDPRAVRVPVSLPVVTRRPLPPTSLAIYRGLNNPSLPPSSAPTKFGSGSRLYIAPQAPSYTPVKNKTWQQTEQEEPEDDVTFFIFFFNRNCFFFLGFAPLA